MPRSNRAIAPLKLLNHTRQLMRTQPLWGLRARAPYLHDGHASRIVDAIQLHDGEAAIVRNRFLAPSTKQQQELVISLTRSEDKR